MAWTDELVRTQAELVYFLRIDGYPVWLFTRTPNSTWTPPSNVTFRDGLMIPETLDQSIRMFEGSSSISPLTFRVQDLATTPGAAISTSNPYFFTQAFATGRALSESGRYAAYLAEDVDESEVAIDVTTAINMPGSAFDLYVGIETMRVTAGFGTTTLTVTRAQYPAVDGAALAMRHTQAIDTAGHPLTLVSDVPFSWYNRRVALYATWYDRASGTFGGRTSAGTPVGGGTNYQLIWTGRLHRMDFDSPTDEWKLECKPLLDDLQRPVMSRPATAYLAQGIQLTGLSVSDRQITVTTLLSLAGSDPNTEFFTLAEGFYSVPSLYVTILSAIAALSDGGFLFLFLVGQSFVVRNTAGLGRFTVTIRLPPVVAVFLGYTDEYVAFTMSGTVLAASSYTFPAPSAGLAALVHPSDATTIQVDTTTGFVQGPSASQQGTDVTRVAPALVIDGKMIRRYTSTTATTFADVFRSAWPSNTNLQLGARMIMRRSSDLSQVPVAQAYAMPRTFGADGTHGVLRELLTLMTSTGLGVNGSFDLLPPGYGLGIPATLVDAASFNDADLIFGGALTERQWMLTEPTPLIDLLLAEAKTLGFYLVINGSGQIALRIIGQTLADATDVVLTESNKAQPLASTKPDRTSFSVSPASLLNQATFTFNYAWGTDQSTKHEVNFVVSQEQYEMTRGVDVENRGLFAFESTDLEEIEASLWARMGIYATSWPTLGRTINGQLFTRLVPGDRVSLTDSAVPDVYTGQRGVSGRSCLVTSVSYNMHTGVGRVSLIHDGILPTSAPLAPALRVTAFDAGTNTATVAANEFSAAPTTDLASFAANDAVLVVEGSAATPTAPINTERTISSINLGANTLVLSGGIGGLNPATSVVYITFTDFNSIVTAQLARGTFAANATTNLIQTTGAVRRYI